MATTTSSEPTQAQKLKEEFPYEALRQLSKGGAKLTYVPVSEVIARLNNVLGVSGWNITSSEAWRDELEPEWVIAKVTIVATVDGAETTRIGWGGQAVKNKSSGGALDLGDEFKGAASDALKKAAMSLGVGLDLARDEDMLFLERELLAEKIKAKHRNFMKDYIEGLNDDEQEALKAWFKANLPGKALNKGNLNVEDFQLFLNDHDLEQAWEDAEAQETHK